MAREIKSAAVIGAGVMGSGIAAHLANAGIPSYLLDIVPRELTDEDKKAGLDESSKAFRNKLSLAGLLLFKLLQSFMDTQHVVGLTLNLSRHLGELDSLVLSTRFL